MKNINRDYLVTVNARTAEIKAPSNMKFYMTDEFTSNIFFQLIFEDSDDLLVNIYKPKENADNYKLILRVVKPNNKTMSIEAIPLDDYKSFFVADLPIDFVNLPGVYMCELFIDTEIPDGDDVLRIERSTTDSFEYEVKESVFYNLDNIIDLEYISIEDIATKQDLNDLIIGDYTLNGYATIEQLNNKSDIGHKHDDYVTQVQLNDSIAQLDCIDLNLEDFVVSNSISINRSENSVIGQYSTAEGDNTAATGYASHSEGYNTVASGKYSHAEGDKTKAKNYSSHAEGALTIANHESSHAEGYCTEANGYASHSEGYHTIANGRYQHVQGKYNIADKTEYAHIVGNGADSENRSNAYTLDWEGNAWFAGDVSVGDNKILATKEYVHYVVASGDTSGDGFIPTYDDTELRNSITELENNVAELENNVEKKADKKTEANKYELVNHIKFDDLYLDNEGLGNRRFIRVFNPSEELRIELPEIIDSDFAEIHMFITPIDNNTEISIDINDETNHINLKYQVGDMIPTTLGIGKIYEYVFTYINYNNDSGYWLVGVIAYE
jgi:hypothetical protein